MHQTIYKGMMNNNSSFIKDMMKSNHSDTPVQAVCNQITNEVDKICKKNESLPKEMDDEEHIVDWFQLAETIQHVAPVLSKLLQHVVSHSQRELNDKIIHLYTGLAVSLNGRNGHLSMLQHDIGLILDQGVLQKRFVQILSFRSNQRPNSYFVIFYVAYFRYIHVLIEP